MSEPPQVKLCQFVRGKRLGGGKYRHRCKVCGGELDGYANPAATCPRPKPTPRPARKRPFPAAPKSARPRGRIRRYLRAVVRWAKRLFPTRSKREVRRIYDTICKPCEKFKGDTCQVCGCKVRRSGVALINKIRMRTEHCHLGKW